VAQASRLWDPTGETPVLHLSGLRLNAHALTEEHQLADRAVSTAPATAEWQLPEHAQCLRCDYRLYGLPEPRCPECGERFDPALWRDAVTPLWPRLLALLIAAQMALLTLNLCSWAVRQISEYVRLGAALGTRDLMSLATIPWIVVMFVAAAGLWKGRDWGRKVYLGLLLVHVAGSMAGLGLRLYTSFRMGWQAGDFLLELPWRIQDFLSGLAPMLMVAFLLTGLRKRSLACRGFLLPAPIPQHVYTPRHDWLLLIAVILSMKVMTNVLPLLVLVRKLPSWFEDGWLGWWPPSLIILACSLAGLICIRRPPAALPRVLAVSLGLILLTTFVFLMVPIVLDSPGKLSPDQFLLRLAGHVLPWAVILIWYRMFQPQLEPASTNQPRS
jgi:hypothetical protein